jgi:hypothetical protein
LTGLNHQAPWPLKPQARACLKLLSVNPFNQPIRSFHLGDPVRVKVVCINAFRSEIDFELV